MSSADEKQAPRAACESTAQTTPAAFTAVLPSVNYFMWRELTFNYFSTQKRSLVPTGVPCVVDCSDSFISHLEIRCIAFAERTHGHLRWYGVTHALQEPILLRGVRGYVPITAELLRKAA